MHTIQACIQVSFHKVRHFYSDEQIKMPFFTPPHKKEIKGCICATYELGQIKYKAKSARFA